MARRGYVQLVFQSTLPLRGATAYRFSIDETLIISIHTPLAGSDVCGRISVDGEFISIHTPLAGSDDIKYDASVRQAKFQSTLPLRGATIADNAAKTTDAKFQSTLPLRGATREKGADHRGWQISIHTPLAGSDRRNETFLTK